MGGRIIDFVFLRLIVVVWGHQSEAKCAPTRVRILIITMGAKRITRRSGNQKKVVDF